MPPTAGVTTPRLYCTADGSWRTTPSTTCPITACSTSSGSSSSETSRAGSGSARLTWAIAICEDIWVSAGPLSRLSEQPPGLLMVINASPYERNKDDARLDLCATRAREAGCALAYVNLWGGQDDLVFDGDSMVVDPHGVLLARSPQFIDDLLVVDVDAPVGHGPVDVVLPAVPAAGPATSSVASALSDAREVYLALVTGLRDYVRKNGFRSVVLGMSGGIDSALVAAIACDAVGPQNVHGVRMPSEYSSAHSPSDAAESAQRTGMNLRTVPINDMVNGPTSRTSTSQAWLQRTCRPACAARSSWRSATPRATWSWPPATRASSRWAIPRSTAMRSAASHRSRMCPRPWCGRWRGGATTRRSVPGNPGPIPPNSIDKPPPRELRRTTTPTRCRTTCSWTASWMTMWAATWARPNSWNAATTPNWSRASCSSPTPRNGNAGSTPWHEDHVPRLRSRPAAADHEPVARAAGVSSPLRTTSTRSSIDTEPAW